MDDELCKQLGISTDVELKERLDRLRDKEENAVSDILKYFDRIQDKLFELNNIIIAGYFALIAIQAEVSAWNILIPVGNFGILFLVEYLMMEKARLESIALSLTQKQLEKHGSLVHRANQLSLLAIITTFFITFFFAYLVISNV